VERSFTWLGNYRRLLIRWEHQSGMYRSFFTVAVMLLCVRRLPAGDGGDRPAPKARALVGNG
jgi:hypothetical protein